MYARRGQIHPHECRGCEPASRNVRAGEVGILDMDARKVQVPQDDFSGVSLEKARDKLSGVGSVHNTARGTGQGGTIASFFRAWAWSEHTVEHYLFGSI